MKRKSAQDRRSALPPRKAARRPLPRSQQANAIPASRGQATTCQIAGHFPVTLRRQLKHLEAETGRTLQDLLGEAIRDFLAKKARPQVVLTVAQLKAVLERRPRMRL
jgi:hypothetical protein